MDAMEKSHAEIMSELKPLIVSVHGISFISKTASFITVVVSTLAAMAHWYHH